MHYNKKVISFLIASFKDMVTNFGKTTQTVEFYKKQVNGLIDIGQINRIDAKFVEGLIGMENTNVVKWGIAENKIKTFIDTVNKIMQYNESAIPVILYYLENENKISKQIKDLILKMYNQQSVNIENTNTKHKFGDLSPSITPYKTKNLKEQQFIDNKNTKKENKSSTEEKIEFSELKGSNENNVYIQIANSKTTYEFDVNLFFLSIKETSLDVIKDTVKKHMNYQVIQLRSEHGKGYKAIKLNIHIKELEEILEQSQNRDADKHSYLKEQSQNRVRYSYEYLKEQSMKVESENKIAISIVNSKALCEKDPGIFILDLKRTDLSTVIDYVKEHMNYRVVNLTLDRHSGFNGKIKYNARDLDMYIWELENIIHKENI